MCDNDVLLKLWKSRKIVLEILETRGYVIPQEDHLTLSEFREWAGNDTEELVRKSMELEYPANPNNPRATKIKIYWPLSPKLGTNIREICKNMEEANAQRAIVIVDVSVTPATNGIIYNLRKEKIYIDVYNINEAQINVAKHVLVPKHELCTEEEKEEVLKTYAVTVDQMPHIFITDPQVRHLGAIEDDLIKITRKSHTMIGYSSISYCMVVEPGPQKKKGKNRM